jgi:hypothetical protein
MEKAIAEGRLPMVDMGDDAKIPNVRCVHETMTAASDGPADSMGGYPFKRQ